MKSSLLAVLAISLFVSCSKSSSTSNTSENNIKNAISQISQTTSERELIINDLINEDLSWTFNTADSYSETIYDSSEKEICSSENSEITFSNIVTDLAEYKDQNFRLRYIDQDSVKTTKSTDNTVACGQGTSYLMIDSQKDEDGGVNVNNKTQYKNIDKQKLKEAFSAQLSKLDSKITKNNNIYTITTTFKDSKNNITDYSENIIDLNNHTTIYSSTNISSMNDKVYKHVRKTISREISENDYSDIFNNVAQDIQVFHNVKRYTFTTSNGDKIETTTDPSMLNNDGSRIDEISNAIEKYKIRLEF